MDDYLEIGTSPLRENLPATPGKSSKRALMYELFGTSSSEEECLDKQANKLLQNEIVKREKSVEEIKKEQKKIRRQREKLQLEREKMIQSGKEKSAVILQTTKKFRPDDGMKEEQQQAEKEVVKEGKEKCEIELWAKLIALRPKNWPKNKRFRTTMWNGQKRVWITVPGEIER